MVINSNIPSITGNRLLSVRQSEVTTSFDKLSSGDRLYSAKENPLDFSISEKMRSQIKGLEAAYRNSVDALNMIRTTDGYLGEISNLITEFRSLAVQAANSIYSDAERSFSQVQATEIVAEIDRVAEYATFNGQKMLDGRFSQPTAESTPTTSLWIQVGENRDQVANAIRLYINTINVAALSLEDLSLSTPQKAIDTIERSENALQVLARNRSVLGSHQVRLESVIKTNQVALENTKAAESSVRDANIADEVTKLTKNLVMNQVNIAMIAQANSQLQAVLRLLG